MASLVVTFTGVVPAGGRAHLAPISVGNLCVTEELDAGSSAGDAGASAQLGTESLNVVELVALGGAVKYFITSDPEDLDGGNWRILPEDGQASHWIAIGERVVALAAA